MSQNLSFITYSFYSIVCTYVNSCPEMSKNIKFKIWNTLRRLLPELFLVGVQTNLPLIFLSPSLNLLAFILGQDINWHKSCTQSK